MSERCGCGGDRLIRCADPECATCARDAYCDNAQPCVCQAEAYGRFRKAYAEEQAARGGPSAHVPIEQWVRWQRQLDMMSGAE